jgi:hypothetical protein
MNCMEGGAQDSDYIWEAEERSRDNEIFRRKIVKQVIRNSRGLQRMKDWTLWSHLPSK